MLLFVGLLEAIDAVFARKNKEFTITLQLAILDMVTGLIVLFELNTTLEKLPILIAAFLMYKGLFRILAPLSVNFPQSKTTILGGLISFILGICIWQEWPISGVWFLTFCLSFDFTMRGYGLTRFALWLNTMAKTDQGDIRSLL